MSSPLCPVQGRYMNCGIRIPGMKKESDMTMTIVEAQKLVKRPKERRCIGGEQAPYDCTVD